MDRTREHKGSYGGEGGAPRTSSDQRESHGEGGKSEAGGHEAVQDPFPQLRRNAGRETEPEHLLHHAVADRDAAYSVLMQGIVQLPDYLERLQGGHQTLQRLSP